MKTEGLTWQQAKNFLTSGVAKFIEFDGKRYTFLNVIFVRNGKFYSQFREQLHEIPLLDVNMYCYNGYFKVVDKPTYTKVIIYPKES